MRLSNFSFIFQSSKSGEFLEGLGKGSVFFIRQEAGVKDFNSERQNLVQHVGQHLGIGIVQTNMIGCLRRKRGPVPCHWMVLSRGWAWKLSTLLR